METALRYNDVRGTLKPVKTRVTPAMLDILDLLQDYDVLPSSYILAAFPSPYATKNNLTPMKKAHLIGIPSGYEHSNALYRIRPLAVFPLGYRLLKEHNRYRERVKGNDHFKHQLFRNVVKYSRDRASSIDGITFVAPPDMSSIPTGDSFIEPDAVWSIRYAHPKGTAAQMTFVEEEDRGTYPARGKSAKRHKSLRKMICTYRDLFAADAFEKQYGVRAISVLIHTTSQARLNTTFDIIKEECTDADIARRFMGKAFPDFINADHPEFPPATAHLITEPYYRIENGTVAPFSIIDTLRATAARKEGTKWPSTPNVQPN